MQTLKNQYHTPINVALCFKKLSFYFRLAVFSLIVTLSVNSSVAKAENNKEPKLVISETIDQIIKVVQEQTPSSSPEERRNKLQSLIEPHFDFKEMSKRSLGAHWSKINPAQQSEFTSAFSDLLSRTYLSYLEKVEPGMVNIMDQSVKMGNSATSPSVSVVRTTVKHKGETFPLNYKLVLRTTGWKVYDVIIENIGLVSNYRSEFAGILRKNGFNGLMDQLSKKGEIAVADKS